MGMLFHISALNIINFIFTDHSNQNDNTGDVQPVNEGHLTVAFCILLMPPITSALPCLRLIYTQSAHLLLISANRAALCRFIQVAKKQQKQ